FFEAEDGIRDSSVTGVQTCALPIWSHVRTPRTRLSGGVHVALRRSDLQAWRSEERRVGKECRSRWSPYHYKKQWTAATVEHRGEHGANRALEQHASRETSGAEAGIRELYFQAEDVILDSSVTGVQTCALPI